MKKNTALSVSISQFQLHLSRILSDSRRKGIPVFITNRHLKSHVLLPMAMVRGEIAEKLREFEIEKDAACFGEATLFETSPQEEKSW